MKEREFFFKYGLIGDNLNLKMEIYIEIDDEGFISYISYRNPDNILDISQEEAPLLVIPGFINSHVHIGDSFAKENGFNLELAEVVAPPSGLKHKLLNNTAEEIIIKGIQFSVREMLSNGITTFVDFREQGIEGIKLIRKALEKSLINYLVLGRFKNQKDLELVFQKADGIGLSSYRVISESIKTEILKLKQNNNKIIACHVAENKRNPELFLQLLNDNIVDIIVHGTKLEREDLKLLLQNGLRLILCPRCNGYFGVGFPPIKSILDLNIPISLGTDNIMANSPDMFEELRYLYRISRVLSPKKKLEAKDLLKMATINGARQYGLENKLGSISKGKQADFFIIDLSAPNYYVSELKNNLVYALIMQRTNSLNILRTYIRGKLAFENKS
ncbi:MAG: amidohydrolase family protein [Promethearchaeia archaeon]